jgi:hypothetical protein
MIVKALNMKVLLLANRPSRSTNANAIIDHIDAFLNYSKFSVTLFNPYGKTGPPENIFLGYDAVIVHYSIVISHDSFLSSLFRQQLSLFRGIKVLFIQDEYRFINETTNAMISIHFDLIFTNYKLCDIYKIYPRKLFENTKFVNNLTGYVDNNLLGMTTPAYDKRDIDVFYRARKLPAWYGRLGYNKYKIGEQFRKLTKSYTSLNLDLSSKENERIYGDKWIEVILNSKCVLGSETAGSVMDFTGEIQKQVEQYEGKHPDASYKDIEKILFPGIDGLIDFGQVSPRHFEAACLKTLMILLEGEYCGILTPWEHYVPLKHDYSNIEEVIAAINNKDLWEYITNKAYDDIASNPSYSYKTFISMVDSEIELASEKLISIDRYENINDQIKNDQIKSKHFSAFEVMKIHVKSAFIFSFALMGYYLIKATGNAEAYAAEKKVSHKRVQVKKILFIAREIRKRVVIAILPKHITQAVCEIKEKVGLVIRKKIKLVLQTQVISLLSKTTKKIRCALGAIQKALPKYIIELLCKLKVKIQQIKKLVYMVKGGFFYKVKITVGYILNRFIFWVFNTRGYSDAGENGLMDAIKYSRVQDAYCKSKAIVFFQRQRSIEKKALCLQISHRCVGAEIFQDTTLQNSPSYRSLKSAPVIESSLDENTCEVCKFLDVKEYIIKRLVNCQRGDV